MDAEAGGTDEVVAARELEEVSAALVLENLALFEFEGAVDVASGAALLELEGAAVDEAVVREAVEELNM